jgi:hypothetical protein
MKNKLLITSALASVLAFASAANAQTTMSGNLALSLKSLSNDTAAGKIQAGRGIGKESQLNITNKGKLSNGMDYVAGFSLELEGSTTGAAADWSENTYIDIISGNTTFTVGVDHIQNSQRQTSSFVGLIPDDAASGLYGSATNLTLETIGANPYQAYGAGIMQKTPFGTFSALYVPTNDNVTAAGTDDGDSTNQAAEAVAKSAYEIGFAGDLGVKGLNAFAYTNEEKKRDAQTFKGKGHTYGASYNFGQVTAGYDYKQSTIVAAAGSAEAGDKIKQHSFGIGFAATKDISIGATYSKAEPSDAGEPDEKVKLIAIGYSLGALATDLTYADVENYAGTRSNDGKTITARIRANF